MEGSRNKEKGPRREIKGRRLKVGQRGKAYKAYKVGKGDCGQTGPGTALLKPTIRHPPSVSRRDHLTGNYIIRIIRIYKLYGGKIWEVRSS